MDLLFKLFVRSVIDYGLIVYFNNLKVTEITRLNQIQYRAAKLCTGALHYTNQSKLEQELAWETLAKRSDFLGLTLFQKIHLGQTRPLIKKCMPVLNINRQNRNNNFYHPFPVLGIQFTNSFFPYFTKLFIEQENILKNECDIKNFKDKLKDKIKPKKIKHFAWGSKRGNALWTQLRVGRSFLNAHGFAINLVDTDLCLSSRSKTVLHFYTKCFLYTEERKILYDSSEQILPKFSILPNKTKQDILLYGINLHSEGTDSRNNKLFLLSKIKF